MFKLFCNLTSFKDIKRPILKKGLPVFWVKKFTSFKFWTMYAKWSILDIFSLSILSRFSKLDKMICFQYWAQNQ